MTEGPTGPKIGAPELLMTSAASLPARSACGIFALGAGHRVQGHWPQPRSEGELWEQLWEPRGLPYLRQEGQEGEPDGTGEEGCKGLSYPVFVPCAHLAWAAGLPRSEWLGQEPF